MTEVQINIRSESKELTDLGYIISNSETCKQALDWAYWWKDNKRYFRPCRELWLEESAP